jgi:hypothetical protein
VIGRVGEGAIPQSGTTPSPLVKPDVRISRIRLSRQLSLPSSTPIPSRLSSAAKPRSKMRTVPQPYGWFSVGGLASKWNAHPLTQRVGVPAPSLHGGYPLLRSCRPVRLPDGAASGVMPSPRALAALPTTPPGLPEPALSTAKVSSTDLSPCAAPNHPGEPGGCSRPLLHHRCQASSCVAAWPLSVCGTRPNRVRSRYGSRVRLARLRQPDLSHSRWFGYLLNEQLQGKLLSSYKISQASPGAPVPRYACCTLRA